MNARNCRKCGKLFNYVSGPPICMACREALEAKFQEVKEYIRNNVHATIPEVAEACDVSQTQIQAWLQDERLQLAEGSSRFSAKSAARRSTAGVSVRNARTTWQIS